MADKKNRKQARLERRAKKQALLNKQKEQKLLMQKIREEEERKEKERLKKLGRKKDRKGKRLKRTEPLKIEEVKKPKEPKKKKSIREDREKRKKERQNPTKKKKQSTPVIKANKPKKPIIDVKDTTDFDKVYYLPVNYYMSISFRDLTCEKSINQILKKYSKMSNKELQRSLKRIVRRKGNYDYELYKLSGGKDGTSNGVAGKANFRLGTMIDVQSDRNMLKNETDAGRKRNEKRISEGKSPIFTHDGRYDYYQEITMNHSPFIKSFTPRNLLIILTGIMENITEVEREDFYMSVIHEFSIIMPEVLEFLPQ